MFRCQYKDLLYLIVEQNNGPIPENVIQMVFSKTYFGDTLVEWVDRQGTIKYGERVGPGVDDPRLHKEHREYLSEHHWIEYLFVTR